jgi:beta-lactam-binding protein with PASTA domain
MPVRQSGLGMSISRSKSKAQRVAGVVVIALIVIFSAAIIVGGIVLYRMIAGTVGKASGQSVTVPNVVGMTQQQAEDALRERGLGSQVVQNANTDEQAAGNVFRQEPPAGRTARPGRTVKIMVSLGPPTYTVPNLIGETLDKAPGILERARLQLGQVQRVYVRSAKRGRIVNQNPIAGASLGSPAPVDITVEDNSGLPAAIVPLLTGRTLAQAEDELVQANLHLAKVVYVANDTVAAGTITKQQPEGNAEAKLGDTVELEVALPTELKDSPTKTIMVRLRIPPGPDKQRVRIKVFDTLGAQVHEDSTHAPGMVIESEISVEGPAKIQIFIGDANTPFREESL